MKIYTIADGNVNTGMYVKKFTPAGANIEVPARTVGCAGRWGRLGVLPVRLLPGSRRNYEEHGNVQIHTAVLTKTPSGRPALEETESSEDNEVLLVIFGRRGGNSLDTYPEPGNLSRHIVVDGVVGDSMGVLWEEWILMARPGDRFIYRERYGTYIIDVRSVNDVWMVSEYMHALACELVDF